MKKFYLILGPVNGCLFTWLSLCPTFELEPKFVRRVTEDSGHPASTHLSQSRKESGLLSSHQILFISAQLVLSYTQHNAHFSSDFQSPSSSKRSNVGWRAIDSDLIQFYSAVLSRGHNCKHTG